MLYVRFYKLTVYIFCDILIYRGDIQMTGLVLEGGANRTFYTVGILDAFLDNLRIATFDALAPTTLKIGPTI